MARANISRFSSIKLDDLKEGARTVLYEELAEYYYLFARPEALRSSSVKAEIDYHIGNLVLISLYFDVVLIQTASIFNATDPFVRKVCDGVLAHSTFKEMLQHNSLKIVGWGGNSPNEMFEAAENFAISAAPYALDVDRFTVAASIFNSQSTVSRADDTPDADIEKLFLNRLEQTTIIRRPRELASVGHALERSMDKTGQLVAVSFNPELGKLELSAQSLDAVGTSFIQSWHDHLASGILGVITYAPISKPVFVNQTMMVSDSTVRTFLYSPQIFASFLSGYLRPRDFNEILKRPYGDLIAIKNGDWKRFCDAYHDAIATVSANIGHLVHAELSESTFSDRGLWSKNIDAVLGKDADQIDVNAFIESLAMLSGVVLTIPFLGPVVKSVGSLLGKRINEMFHALRVNASTEVSPFIRKLLRHYELDGARA